MNKKEMIISILEKKGYKPEIDNDGDILIRYQMKSIFVIVGNIEDTYVSVLLPQFHEIVDGEEPLVLATCNKMTRDLKMVKVYVDQTFKKVSATCEFFFSDEKSLEENIEHSLELLGVVRSVFRKNKTELSEC
jgi:hypothetical protein